MALGVVGWFVAPAGAVPKPDHKAESLNIAGSDTSYFVMNGLVQLWNSDTKINEKPPKNDTVFNTPPRLGGAFPASFHVDGDANCGAINYPPTNPPDGSSAGISALVADGTSGCVDLARSSRGRTAADPANLQFYAYGIDALTWTYFPGSHAPTNLTQQNLIDIYTCNPATGAPFVSNWSQVGGTNGKIVKFAPQQLSGTYSFFNSKILNGAAIDQNCNASHLSHFKEEHDNTAITKAQKPFAINAFSFAQWNAMKNKVITDRRNGGKLGSINGVKPNYTTVNTGANHFIGSRYIYNVLKTNEPSYDATLRFAGVDSSGPGWLCKSSAAIRAKIKLYGDVPLKKDVSGPGLPKSYCRFEPTPL